MQSLVSRFREKALRRFEMYKSAKHHASMVPEKNQELLNSIAAYWTSERIRAKVADLVSGSMEGRRLYDVVLAAAPEIEQYDAILDFGSGTGWLAKRLSNQYPSIRFYCYDLAYLASRELFESLQRTVETERMRYHDRYEDLLPECDLVFSNEVFSTLAPTHLDFYLSRFKKASCDLLFLSASFMKQRAGGTASRRRGASQKYSHNYSQYLVRHGYELKWLYHLSLQGKDKNLIAGYATARG